MIRQNVDRIRKLKLRRRKPRCRDLIEPAAAIDLAELRAAECDPHVHKNAGGSANHGERVKREQLKRRKNMLIYEGSIYVRPIGRGIVLEDEPGEPHLDEWVEAWLMKSALHRSMTGNFYARLDIVIKDVSKAPDS